MVNVFVKHNGNVLGPIPLEKALSSYKRGQLSASTLISENQSTWYPITELDKIQEKSETTPAASSSQPLAPPPAPAAPQQGLRLKNPSEPYPSQPQMQPYPSQPQPYPSQPQMQPYPPQPQMQQPYPPQPQVQSPYPPQPQVQSPMMNQENINVRRVRRTYYYGEEISVPGLQMGSFGYGFCLAAVVSELIVIFMSYGNKAIVGFLGIFSTVFPFFMIPIGIISIILQAKKHSSVKMGVLCLVFACVYASLFLFMVLNEIRF